MNQGANEGAILCVGRVYCDIIFTGMHTMPQLGRETFADGLKLHAGGGGYITAAYLSALGSKVSLAAMLPAQPFGAVVTAEIKQMEIDDRFCQCATDESDPQITVAMVRNGERAFLTRRPNNALPTDIAKALSDPALTHLHIGELTTLIEHPELIQLARDAGLSISLDCGWDENAFKHPDLERLIGSVDVFLPNSMEAAQLLENGVAIDVAPVTVIKRGADGAELHAKGACHARPGLPANVVDTTGAGDAFNAGFIHAWLAGMTHDDCLDAGNKSGALAVGCIGGAANLSPSSLQRAKTQPEPDLHFS